VRVRALIGRATAAVGSTAALLFLGVVAVSALEVVLRYGFASPTVWAHELSVALAAAAFAIGGPVVHARRGHIAITWVLDRAGAPTRALVTVVNALLILVFLGLLVFAASRQALDALDVMETSGTATDWYTPVILKCLLALCAVWMLLQTAGQLVADVRALLRGGNADARTAADAATR
jgi:TRAP-type C4-dicarboxylate transport system permease small subunit